MPHIGRRFVAWRKRLRFPVSDKIGQIMTKIFRPDPGNENTVRAICLFMLSLSLGCSLVARDVRILIFGFALSIVSYVFCRCFSVSLSKYEAKYFILGFPIWNINLSGEIYASIDLPSLLDGPILIFYRNSNQSKIRSIRLRPFARVDIDEMIRVLRLSGSLREPGGE